MQGCKNREGLKKKVWRVRKKGSPFGFIWVRNGYTHLYQHVVLIRVIARVL